MLGAGWTVDRTRKTILLAAALLMPTGILVGFVPEAGQALALISLVTFLIQVWATSLFAIPSDLYPASQVGSVVGLAAATGSVSAMLFQLLVGEVVQRFGYTPIFVTVALMHPLALICIHLLLKKIDRISR
jgi:ACS family hexuronate transporter-like MFS transporter